MYTYFIGVDISKDTLDIALVLSHNTLLDEKQIAAQPLLVHHPPDRPNRAAPPPSRYAAAAAKACPRRLRSRKSGPLLMPVERPARLAPELRAGANRVNTLASKTVHMLLANSYTVRESAIYYGWLLT